jgi:hypothetical protein
MVLSLTVIPMTESQKTSTYVHIPFPSAEGMRPWIIALMAFILSRSFLFIVGIIAPKLFTPRPAEGTWHVAGTPVWLEMWARWDSGFYLEIVKYGYRFIATEQTSAAFFPLYPILIKFFTWFTQHELLAGVLVSNACLYLLLVVFYKLTLLDFSEQVAQRAMVYLLLFPTSFFFSAVYTESTFLLFALLSVYAARKSRWGLAGIAGMLAASSRVVGVIFWGVIGLEWLRQHGWTIFQCLKVSTWSNLWQGLKKDGFSLIALSVVPLGLFSYMAFLQHYFADPVAFMTVQAAWQRETLGVIGILQRDLSGFIEGLYQGQFYYQVLLDVPVLLISLPLSYIVWRRLGAGYALYVILGLVVPASSSTQSLSRYVLVLFPVFMLLGHWGQKRSLHIILLVIFIPLSALCFALFVNWYFVA